MPVRSAFRAPGVRPHPPTPIRGGAALLGAFLLLTPAPIALAAQTPATEGPIPPEVEAAIFDFLNAPDVLRSTGGTRIPAGSRVEGDVATLGGAMDIGGELVGNLLVVNGDLSLLPGARITGQILVVGGTISGEAGASLEDEVRVYAYPLRYRVRAGRVEPLPPDGFAPGFLERDLGFGLARFTLRTGANYNRVEGLPVHFGPLIRTGGSNPLRLQTFGIWRSVSGLSLDSDRLGYDFEIEQAVGGRGVFSLGASAHNDIVPIEERGLSDAEASLATFMLDRDFRDYYEREGWSAFLNVSPAQAPLRASVTYREEEHATPPLRNPWTLRGGDDPWRPLALTAEGRLRSVEASLAWDSRNDPERPSDGWWLGVGVQRQVGGELRLAPSAADPGDDELPELHPAEPLPFFTRGTIDLRHYARVGPTSRLSVRAVAAGSITGTPLPPQYQLAPGGEGSLPGHPRFALDCGARATTRVALTGEADEGRGPEIVHPAYGCDRSVLFQAEFQGGLPFSWSPVPEDWDDGELAGLLDLRPTWALFLNAGQGWARRELGDGLPRVDGPTRADAGVGLFLGPVGLYWSYPLNRGDRGVNFFVRLQQRF